MAAIKLFGLSGKMKPGGWSANLGDKWEEHVMKNWASILLVLASLGLPSGALHAEEADDEAIKAINAFITGLALDNEMSIDTKKGTYRIDLKDAITRDNMKKGNPVIRID